MSSYDSLYDFSFDPSLPYMGTFKRIGINQKYVCMLIDEPIDLTQPFQYRSEMGKSDLNGSTVIAFWLNKQINPIENGIYGIYNHEIKIVRAHCLKEGDSYYNTIFRVWDKKLNETVTYKFNNERLCSTVGTHIPITSYYNEQMYTLQSLMLSVLQNWKKNLKNLDINLVVMQQKKQKIILI